MSYPLPVWIIFAPRKWYNISVNTTLISARDVYREYGYARWENFANLIKRAQNLIESGERLGRITETRKPVTTGFGAVRQIVDYLLDDTAAILVGELASSVKLTGHFHIRNETVLLGLARKYCMSKGIMFKFQYPLSGFVYDALVGDSVLIEFDEPGHLKGTRQRGIDAQKDVAAQKAGLTLLRFDLTHDIIDIIVAIEEHC